jgi:hypothetical protein
LDIGKAFSFVFEDEEWICKILIGGLISLIPLVGQFVVLGYALKVAQNVAQGNPRPLPRWGEFGDHLVRGLYEFVIRLVYALPIVLIALLFACLVRASLDHLQFVVRSAALPPSAPQKDLLGAASRTQTPTKSFVAICPSPNWKQEHEVRFYHVHTNQRCSSRRRSPPGATPGGGAAGAAGSLAQLVASGAPNRTSGSATR